MKKIERKATHPFPLPINREGAGGWVTRLRLLRTLLWHTYFLVVLLLLSSLPVSAQGTVTRIEFEGNRCAASDSLKSRMRLKEGAPYDAALLAADTDSLTAWYRGKGFESRVSFHVYGDAEKRISAVITEEPATLPLRITGNRFYKSDRLQDLYREAGALSAITTAYRKAGFPDCSLSVDCGPDSAFIIIYEGEQLLLGDLRFSGNDYFPAESLLLAGDIRPREPGSEARVRGGVEAWVGV